MVTPSSGNRFFLVWLTLMWLLIRGADVTGQTAFGTIVGTVTDPSQAAIPDAVVTVTNQRTGVARRTATDQYGNYTVPSLLPGSYVVKVEHSGFRVVEVTGVQLEVTRTVRADVGMQLGAETQAVEVTAETQQLDTASGTVGTVVNTTSVEALPLNGRSFTDLIQLVPGAVPRGKLFAIAGGHNFSVSGNSPDVNNFTLDGVQNNDLFFKAFASQPSIDAIQEFRVQTNITSAEYGQGAAANVNVAIKSGTNELHGSVFEFLRNDVLDANDFFRNYSGQDKPAFRQNQWGTVVGGPVYIPGVYDGRNKLFWLFNYEGFKIRRESTLIATVPTQDQLSGDLRGLRPVFDPATSRVDPLSGQVIRDQVSCDGVLNVICANRINPATADWARLVYPVASVNNIVNTNPRKLDQYQLNMRADYKMRDNLTFFARYSPSTANESVPQALPSMATITTQQFYNGVISATYVPSATTVIDAKVGFNRTGVLQAASDPGVAAFLQQHPLQGVIIKSPSYPLMPALNITDGWTGTFSSGTISPTNDIQHLFKLSNIRGKHTLSAGYSLDFIWGLHDNLNETAFNFNPDATADPQNIDATGAALASFLLGFPAGGQRRLGETGLNHRWNMYHFFVNDDIKVTPRLTLNLGLRYEYTQLPAEKFDRVSQFDRHTNTYLWAGNNPITGEAANTRRSIRDPDFNNFAPRIGLAYQLDSKTTVRGGYGVFYVPNYLWELQAHRGQWPYALIDNISALNKGATLTPIDTMFSPDTAVTPGTPPNASWSGDRKDKFGYTQQWNLGVQRQLATDLLLEVNYVASKATKMPIFSFQNLPVPGPGVIGSPEHPRPYPKQDSVIIVGENKASANYHSMQVKLEKRFSRGLQVLGSYAYGHYIDVGGGGNSTQSFPQDERNLHGDRASGYADFRHIFTGSYVYELPFGRGRRFLTQAPAVLNHLAGGWAISGITQYHTGGPINVTLGYDNVNTGFPFFLRPDRVLGQPARVSVAGDKTQGWLNPNAFAAPAQYVFGNLGRNTERGPAFGNWDIILFKNFALHGERLRLQFRTEFFNAFNNVNLGDPTASAPTINPNFGRIFGTQNASRQIQFALKVLF